MWKLSLNVVHLLVSKVKLDHCKNLILNTILISDGEDEVGLISEGGGVSGEPGGGGGQWEGNGRGVTLQWVLTLNRVGRVV